MYPRYRRPGNILWRKILQATTQRLSRTEPTSVQAHIGNCLRSIVDTSTPRPRCRLSRKETVTRPEANVGALAKDTSDDHLYCVRVVCSHHLGSSSSESLTGNFGKGVMAVAPGTGGWECERFGNFSRHGWGPRGGTGPWHHRAHCWLWLAGVTGVCFGYSIVLSVAARSRSSELVVGHLPSC